MELTKWSPYQFDQLSQVMDLYFHHFTLLMARFVCTLDQYREERIKFNFHTLAWFSVSTFINCNSIVTLILISFQWKPLDYVNRCWEQLIQVKRIDIFFLLLCFIFICDEYMSSTTFLTVVQHRFNLANLVWSYKSNLDRKLSGRMRQTLLTYFNRVTFLSGLLRKSSFAALLSTVVAILVHTTLMYTSGDITLLQLLFMVYFMSCVKFFLSHGLAMMFVLLTHVIFLTQISRTKLKLCLIYIKAARMFRHNRFWITKFQTSYVEVSREIHTISSDNIKNYWLSIDLIAKFSLTGWVIFYTKQERIGLFSCCMLSIFAFIFIYFEALYFYFSYFPWNNRRCYINLASWSARKQLNGDQEFSNARICIRMGQLIKTVSENKLGFTCGNLYLITRFKFFEMITVNFIFLTLFYKNFRF